MSKIGNSIAVISGKGGVGKTTVAVNLAVALADILKARVGLLDVDITGPNVARMLGLQHAEMVVEEAILPVKYHFTGWDSVDRTLEVMSIAFLTPTEDTPIVWRGKRKTAAINQMLQRTKWGKLDFLVIDTPPGTSDEIITVLEQLRGSSLSCLIVTLPQEISQIDVSKAIVMSKVMEAKIFGILENMSGFWPGDAQVICDRYDLDLLGRIPMDPSYAAMGDGGRPIYTEHESIMQIYNNIILQSIKKGMFGWKLA